MRITGATCERFSTQLTEPYTIAYETVDRTESILVFVHASNGKSGAGAAAPDPHVTGETAAQVQETFDTVVKPTLFGCDPTRIAHCMERVKKAVGRSPSLLAAVDMALFDLLGKIAGLPVYRLIGGYRTRMRTSVTIGIHDVAETVSRGVEWVAQGFTCLKVKGGSDPVLDVERVVKLREAVGRSIKIRFDANQGYTVAQAVAFVTASQPARLELLEQPTPRSEPDLLGPVTDGGSVPVMADESVMNLRDAFYLARHGLVDMINIKLMKTGGIAEAIQVNSVARSARFQVMVGCMDEVSLGIAAGLHFALSRPNIRFADLDGHLDLVDDPTRGCVVLRNGELRPLERPGLGWEP